MEKTLRRLYSRVEISLARARVITVNMDKCDEFEIYLRNILNRTGKKFEREGCLGGSVG